MCDCGPLGLYRVREFSKLYTLEKLSHLSDSVAWEGAM